MVEFCCTQLLSILLTSEMTPLLNTFVESLQHLFFSVLMPTIAYVIKIAVDSYMQLVFFVMNNPQPIIATAVVLATVCLVHLTATNVQTKSPKKRVSFSGY